MTMLPRRRQRFRTGLLLGLGLATTGASLVTYGVDLFRPLELASVDARFSVRGTETPPDDLLVVQIDDVTFNELGAQWPFPRSLHARVIDRLADAGARTIVYDVQFTEATEEAEDVALLDAVAEAGNVVLATTEVGAGGATNVFGGDDVVRDVGARVGNANMPSDPGGVLRRLPHAVDGLETLAVVAAERANGLDVTRADFVGAQTYIDYHGPPGTIATRSFSAVLQGRVPASAFRGKLVVVGPSAPTLHDVHPTPTSGGGNMSGAEIQANAISTVLRGLPLRGVPDALTLALIVILGLLAPLASILVSLRATLTLAFLGGAGYVVAAQLAFEWGRVISFSYPFVALLVSSIGVLGSHYVFAAFERERARDAFSRFVPDKVVEQVLARTGGDLRLGGVEMVGTAMFTDVRGFTSFAESLPPAQVIEVLNQYLGEMSEAILDHGGTLVAYIGDGIFAVFGAPIEQPDHADRAIATAGEMIDVRLPRFNAWMEERGYTARFRIGIGLNTGTMLSGNVGSERRLEYTAIGDSINTASRIEGMTKGTPYQLLLSDATHRAVTDPAAHAFVHVGESDVRGRQHAVTLWSLEVATDADALRTVERAASS